MLLPSIWMLEAELPRTAVKAQLLMRLPRTMTLPARNTLMALPYWPEPPARLSIASMRLSTTMVPSSPAAERQTWMPLLPASKIVLRAISRPRRVERMDRGIGDVGRAGVSTISPSTAMHMMPLRPEPTISQSAILHAAAVLELDEAGAARAAARLPPSRTRPDSADVVGAPADDQRAPHRLSTSLVAPRTPTSLRAGGKLHAADAIGAGRDGERAAAARGLVDGALQRAALVVGGARAQAELRGVDAERANGGRAGAALRGDARRWRLRRGVQSEQVATIGVHGGSFVTAVELLHEQAECRQLQI